MHDVPDGDCDWNVMLSLISPSVIPVKTGVTGHTQVSCEFPWIPACAGTTKGVGRAQKTSGKFYKPLSMKLDLADV
jgi:hypothetical protein